MSDAILSHLGNQPDLASTPRYAAIIGERPSLGARSPLLWNAVFESMDMTVKFHPFDVAETSLEPLLEALRADERFIGGAVSVPHKATLLPFLDEVEPPAQRIGAVNALYRKGAALVGANTDGAGALASLLECCCGPRSLPDGNALVIGTGGAGQAVAVYIADVMSEGDQILLSNRDLGRAKALAERIGPKARAVSWPPSAVELAGTGLLVNCSSIGFSPGERADSSPERYLTSLSAKTDPAGNIQESLIALRELPSGGMIFDIVYQPRDTMLLTLGRGLGLKTQGGLSMNLEQAVIAFAKAVPDVPETRIREIMSNAT